MNKVYLIQGGALEDYLSGSQGGGTGNGGKDECQIPFTPCWCETRPNNPNCDDQPPAATINDFTPLMLLAGAVLLIIAVRSRIKNKLNN